MPGFDGTNKDEIIETRKNEGIIIPIFHLEKIK